MKNKCVLLVDDDTIANFLTRKILEEINLASEIHTAMNGKEALHLFNSYYAGDHSLPDIILLDLNMPIMDGFEFLEAFQHLNLPKKDTVKIIIVTSSFSAQDKARAEGLGISQFLNKPLTPEGLLEAIQFLN